VGIDPEFSFYLISIANAASGFGRLFSGVMADRIGPWLRSTFFSSAETYNMFTGAVNIMAPCTIVAGIMTYIWPFVTTKGSFIAISIVYG
jgi:hypothetical protein